MKLSFSRSIWSYSKVQTLVGLALRNRRIQVARLPDRSLLNLGCGNAIHPDFLNLDWHWRPGVNLCWDLSKRLPLVSDSMRGVYTEHCLEHLELPVVRFVVGEVFRVLQRGATFRVVVPDFQLYFSLYAQFQSGLQPPVPYHPHPLPPSITPFMAIEEVFFLHGHRTGFDFEKLELLLQEAGFSEIRRASFHQGRNPELLIDSPEREIESLYVEAVKP